MTPRTDNYHEPSQICTFVYCQLSWWRENREKLRFFNHHLEIGKYDHEHHWQGTNKRKEIYLISHEWKLKGKCDYIETGGDGMIPIEIKKRRWNGNEPLHRDVMQLTAIHVLLKERYKNAVSDHGKILYTGSRKKHVVVIDGYKIRSLKSILKKMNAFINFNKIPPRPANDKKCRGCSFEMYCNS